MDINGKSTAAENLPTGRIYMDSDKVPTLNIPATETVTLKDMLDMVKDMLDRVTVLEKENKKMKELVNAALERIQKDGE